MSAGPTAVLNPFVATTTPAMERANRLMSLRTQPGFLDLIRLSLELVTECGEKCDSFDGWDSQKIVFLKMQSQAAKEHHVALFGMKVNAAIQQGIAEGRELLEQAKVPQMTVQEAVEAGDYVRVEVLKKFEEADSRAAGSF